MKTNLWLGTLLFLSGCTLAVPGAASRARFSSATGTGTATSTATATGTTTATVTATSTATSTATAAEVRSAFVPASYVRVFGDEFDGAALDTSRWWTRYIYSGGTLDYLNDEIQRFREDGNHPVSAGTLKLVAKPQSDGKFTSGMIRSKMTMKYGYFETRVKMPDGLGTWTAFWLNPEDMGWPPEIDIFEYLNNGTDDRIDMFNTRGQGAANGPQQYTQLSSHPTFDNTWKTYRAPYNFSDGFHVFGALWDTDDTVTITLDGVLISKFGYKWLHNDGSDAGRAHVLLNLAMGGNWAGRYGVDRTRNHTYEIDYVRVYQKPTAISTGTSNIGVDLCPAGGGC